MTSFKRMFTSIRRRWQYLRRRKRSVHRVLRPRSKFHLELIEPRLLLSGSINLWSGDIPNGAIWQAGDVQRIIADGTGVVRYDNETGKGGHRHYGEREEPYGFTDVGTLLADFLADIVRMRKDRT